MSLKNNLFKFDRQKITGYDFLIGTDEAGRGPGAGPVCAAAVCFKSMPAKVIKLLSGLNDSKKLTEKVREELFEIITANSIYSVKFSNVKTIEKINILQASLIAMKLACEDVINQLNSNDTLVLIDGNKLIPKFQFRQEYIIKGDSKSAAIAAASILAKVSRDKLMKELDKEFPEYHWAQNKGYLTQKHLEAIDKHGITKYHRKKFLEKHFEKITQNQLELKL